MIYIILAASLALIAAFTYLVFIGLISGILTVVHYVRPSPWFCEKYGWHNLEEIRFEQDSEEVREIAMCAICQEDIVKSYKKDTWCVRSK